MFMNVKLVESIALYFQCSQLLCLDVIFVWQTMQVINALQCLVSTMLQHCSFDFFAALVAHVLWHVSLLLVSNHVLALHQYVPLFFNLPLFNFVAHEATKGCCLHKLTSLRLECEWSANLFFQCNHRPEHFACVCAACEKTLPLLYCEVPNVMYTYRTCIWH